MSYTPTEWVTGDIVTAEKLNKLENAVVDGVVPDYTSADKGKVLTLGDGSGSEMVVAVPEQTVTITGGQPEPLSDADESVFVVGRTGVLTYNGTDYNVFCEDAEGTLVFGSDDCPVGILLLHAGVCLGGMAQTATVSLTVSVPSVEPKWQALQSGGGQCVGFAIPVEATGNVGEETWSLNGVTIADVETAFNSGKLLYFTGNFAAEWVGSPIKYTVDESDPEWHSFSSSFFTVATGGTGGILRYYLELWSNGEEYNLQGSYEPVYPVS